MFSTNHNSYFINYRLCCAAALSNIFDSHHFGQSETKPFLNIIANASTDKNAAPLSCCRSISVFHIVTGGVAAAASKKKRKKKCNASVTAVKKYNCNRVKDAMWEKFHYSARWNTCITFFFAPKKKDLTFFSVPIPNLNKYNMKEGGKFSSWGVREESKSAVLGSPASSGAILSCWFYCGEESNLASLCDAHARAARLEGQRANVLEFQRVEGVAGLNHSSSGG